MPFAQLVIGPPGSGKSTYCNGMQQFMSAIGRKCSIVNLDPANDQTSYAPAVDVRELVTLEEIMKENTLGPNGAVLYALEELEENFEWLEDGLHNLGEDYVLFDCPGQVEIFTHHSSLRNMFFKIQKLGYRLVVVHLVDSYNLTLPSMYISALLLSLRAMLQMDLPHLNVLTKIDNLSKYPPLPFNLDFYTEVHDLSHLIPHLNEEAPWLANSKFDALNSAIVELVQDFSLVGFEALAVEDKKSMMSLLHAIDRAGGYAFGSAEGANDTVWQVAVREGMGVIDVKDVQERWLDAKDEWDEKERQDLEAEARARETTSGGHASGGDDDMDMDESMSNVPPNNGIKVVRKNK
ncbi:ATP-binding domain 1 family member B [Nannizzia gypsea CBS 118893]|uniref:GPN-loop GTPase 2 n=1 Tax=Arthroderma gypseum (strain ATCC MYA-4604 / CBS 118893) TaxID=535722 RepID=E5R2B9_ARTGP|nr:ATP-binding domain 1 family member B [Nannizzia gypsea CBS 118893]EFQ97009.1 ATP-binding domain 1 family member B [Nannizzia gypsea CBS 118893]